MLKACAEGNLREVKALVSSGCDVNTTGDYYDNTGLMCALERRHSAVAEYLLSLPSIDVHKSNDYGQTCLHCAARGGASPALVRTILSKMRPDTVNTKDSDGRTALATAVMCNQLSIVSILGTTPYVLWDREYLETIARYVLCILYTHCTHYTHTHTHTHQALERNPHRYQGSEAATINTLIKQIKQ